MDFTAAWCVTCQYNKRTTLANPEVLAAFEANKVALLRADWTSRDAVIAAELQRLGRSGVPVYVFYEGANAPRLLSELPSVEEVRAAVSSNQEICEQGVNMKRSASILAAAAAIVFGAALVQGSVSVGQAAPDFKVRDTSGKEQSLAAYKGKFVVLEWTNPDCPFVQKHYDTANMPAVQKAAEAKGAVWLTVSSTAKDRATTRNPPNSPPG